MRPPQPATRFRAAPPAWRSLTPADRATLSRLLGREPDRAFARRAWRLLDYLALRDGETVLDYGCGMGFYLLAMGRLRRVQLVGIDGDRRRLGQARAARVPGDVLLGDGQRLPFADATFDSVLASEVIEHLPDDTAGLREIWRVLRPGGKLAISVPHARYPFWWDPISRMLELLGRPPIRSGPIATIWSNHVRLYTPATLFALVADAGFEVEALEEATHYSIPFAHFLLYGVGKPLLEHNLLPAPLRRGVDRLAGSEHSGIALDPVAAGVALLRAVDGLNDGPHVEQHSTFVNILLSARKPAPSA